MKIEQIRYYYDFYKVNHLFRRIQTCAENSYIARCLPHPVFVPWLKTDLHTMCFSPAASFSSAAILSVAGTVSLASSRTAPQRILSGIPLVFAMQQATEGVLWLALKLPGWATWQTSATYAFLVFAQMVWPVYIPLAMLAYEQVPWRKKIITALLLIGIGLSAYIGYCLYRNPVSAVPADHHIRYDQGFPLAYAWYYGLLYFLPTVLSSVISGTKRLRWLGYLFLISYVVARTLFHYYEISVWCFFGSVISFIIVLLIRPHTPTAAA